ncbi:hypothetical protein GCM10011531_06970 [Aquaticitalea lipolytica]|uniref:Uncharacterized protein n=1 Tax=Aquaticitalea lipolytica TaxID=1247562 RepID=A0A8J2TN23_9FLAO|nr:hypothetical protein [Aquaticitalea lipolytica]GFZ79669.1 hypothetical protein GCM10011531_06970 [Aquaticitalea lipolytica]
MTQKLDDLELEYIQELAKSSQEIQDLIKEKQKAIDDLDRSKQISFKKYEPAPYPKGDIRIIKMHTKSLKTDKQIERETSEVKNDYNNKIKQALEEKAFKGDQDYIYPVIKKMNKEDTAILLERGRQAYKEKILESSLTLNLDDIDDQYQSLYLSFEENEKDIDKSPSPSDDYE